MILGGTRNLGHITALSMLEAGHAVAVLNRGITPDELPAEVERLHADRANSAEMSSAVGPRSFDLVVDNTTYTGADALQAVSVFSQHAGRYVFISSGQVYLVRENVSRPFSERDYDGPVMQAPPADSPDHSSWLYGADKRAAEAVFREAAGESQFPVTILRLPMVASERDHYGRIQGYIARLMDAGPLLVPDDGTRLPLRHVYAGDVARLITTLVSSDTSIGEAYNISHGESLTLAAFLMLLSSATGSATELLEVSGSLLLSSGILPDCSPFSGRWMSELDNTKSLAAFPTLTYTPPVEYLGAIARDYATRWLANGSVPDGYCQRAAELAFAAGYSVSARAQKASR